MSLGSLENPPMNPSPQRQKHFSAEIINSVNIFFNFTFYHKPVILVITLVKSLSNYVNSDNVDITAFDDEDDTDI